jgi:hypothetical protein
MWYPRDPDGPASEIYRLMPPRPRSELREALDAATGRGWSAPGRDDEAITPAPGPAADRKAARYAGGLGGLVHQPCARDCRRHDPRDYPHGISPHPPRRSSSDSPAACQPGRDSSAVLVQTLARICDDPYDRLFSLPTGKDPHERMGELGDSGYQATERGGLVVPRITSVGSRTISLASIRPWSRRSMMASTARSAISVASWRTVVRSINDSRAVSLSS